MLDTPRRKRPRGSELQVVHIRGGYKPDKVYGRAGEPLTLVFRREETAPCSETVIFAALGKSATLPPYEDVRVELPAAAPGVYEFTCGMGMLHGTLILEDREERR